MYHVNAGKSWGILWRVGIEQEATPPGNRCHGLVKVFKERSLYKKCRAGNRWRPLVLRKFRAFALRAPHLLASEKSEIGPPTTNWQLALAKLYDTCDQFSQGKKHFITSRRKTSVTNDLEWFFFTGWNASVQEFAPQHHGHLTTRPRCRRWTRPPCPPPPPTCGTCAPCPTCPSPGWASLSHWGQVPGRDQAILTGFFNFQFHHQKSQTRPNYFLSLTDELLVKILAYLTSKELMGVAR